MICFCVAVTLIVAEPQLIQSFQLGGPIAFVRFSADGKKLSSLERNGGGLELREISTDKPLLSVHMGGRVRIAAYNPTLEVASVIRADYAPQGEVRSLVKARASQMWVPKTEVVEGASLVSDRSGTYTFFPEKDGSTSAHPVDESQPSVRWPFKVTRCGLDRRGKVAAVNTGNSLYVISIPSGRILYKKPWNDGSQQVEINEKAKGVVIIGASEFSIWNYRTGALKTGQVKSELSGAAAISPRGDLLWVGNQHGGADLFNLKDFSFLFTGGSSEMGSSYFTSGIDVSPDGTEVAAGFATEK